MTDPWGSLSSPEASLETANEDDAMEQSNRCIGRLFTKKVPKKKQPMRMPARKTATYTASGKVPADMQSLLTAGSEDSSADSGAAGVSRGNAHHQQQLDASLKQKSSDDSSRSTPLKKRHLRLLHEILASVTPGHDRERQEKAPYKDLHSGSCDSLSPRKSKQGRSSDDLHEESSWQQQPSETPVSSSSSSSPALPAHKKLAIRAAAPSRKGSCANAPSWSSSLPVVAEEKFEGSSSSQGLWPCGGGTTTLALPTTTPQSAETVQAMKTLVRNQQKSINDMEKENELFRGELAEYRKMLAEAKYDRTKLEETIGQLEVEKKISASQILLLREEMKALKDEIALMKRGRSAPPAPERVQQAIEIAYFDAEAEKDSSKDSIDKLGDFKMALRGSTHDLDSLLKSTDVTDVPDDLTAASSESSCSESGRKPNQPLPILGNTTPPHFFHKPDHHQEFPLATKTRNQKENFFYASNPGEDDDDEDDETSQSSTTRPREEVNMFKTRLEAIQKKREERKIREGGFGSRSGRVHFV